MSDHPTVGARTAAAEIVRLWEDDHGEQTMSDAQRATLVEAMAHDLATAAATAADHEARLVTLEKLTHALADIAITAGDAALAGLPAVQSLKADLTLPLRTKSESSPRDSRLTML